MATKPTGYIVVFDDEQGLCFPYGADPKCEGALSPWSPGDRQILMFDSPGDARKAIRISKAKAKLDTEQGKPANDDFIGGAKSIQIVPVLRARKVSE